MFLRFFSFTALKQRSTALRLYSSTAGFSALEMLLVTGLIVLLLGAAVLVGFRDQPAKNRNTERLQEVNAISQALTQWSLDTGTYLPANLPTTPTCIGTNQGGEKLWAQDVMISPSNVMGTFLIADKSGNTIVVWIGAQSGKSAVFAQKFDASGQKIWNNGDDVLVAVVPDDDYLDTPAATVDANGDVFIVWARQDDMFESSPFENGVYIAKLRANNGTSFLASPLRVNAVQRDFPYAPSVLLDSQGYIFAVWQDNGTGDDIYAQKLDPTNGSRMWAGDIVVNAATTGDQQGPYAVIDNYDNIFVAWQVGDIYLQKLNASDGSRMWGADKIVNATTAGGQSNATLDIDVNGSIIAVWVGTQGGTNDIYLQKLNASDGSRMWGADVLVNMTTTGAQFSSSVASDFFGNIIIVWQGNQAGNRDVYAQKFDATGTRRLWNNAVDLMVSTVTTGDQDTPDVVIDSNGNAIIMWTDVQTVNPIPYSQKFFGGCFDVSPYLAPTYLNQIPEDPKNTNGQSDTGYTIYKNANNEIVIGVSSSLAELGEVIEARRK